MRRQRGTHKNVLARAELRRQHFRLALCISLSPQLFKLISACQKLLRPIRDWKLLDQAFTRSRWKNYKNYFNSACPHSLITDVAESISAATAHTTNDNWEIRQLGIQLWLISRYITRNQQPLIIKYLYCVHIVNYEAEMQAKKSGCD